MVAPQQVRDALICRELDLRLSETSALATERDGRHLQIEG
jgi:hypothetical protein